MHVQPKTFYQLQLLKIMKEHYPDEAVCSQVMNARLMIDQQFDKNLAVPDMAREACCSLYHFIRLFRNLYGMTPYQYLAHVRLLEACKLLRKGIPVSHVAYAVGFGASCAFAKFFKKATGLSPTDFRQEHSRRKGEQFWTSEIPSSSAALLSN